MQANNTKGNYDVFISCKSEDYVYAEEIYDYLVENGFRVFMASRELRKVGDSEYRKAIASALRSAYHLIVFASKAEYIESEWVYYEWDMFVNAKLKGFKQGNIFTILKDVQVNDIPMDLWKYESMTPSNYKGLLLNYVETPEHVSRLKELKAQRAKEEAERRKQEELEQKRGALKEQLREITEEYNEQSVIINSTTESKVKTVLYQLGIADRMCPVCGTKTKLDDKYCTTCGWVMAPVDGIPECGYMPSPEHMEFHRKLYDRLRALTTANEQLDSAKKKIADLEKQTNDQLRSAQKRIAELEKQIKDLTAKASGPARPVSKNGPYKIIFQTYKSEGRATLARYLTYVSNLSMAGAQLLVEKSAKGPVELVLAVNQEKAIQITAKIISITGGTANYVPV